MSGGFSFTFKFIVSVVLLTFAMLMVVTTVLGAGL